MANGIRTGDPRGFNKGRSSKFSEGSRVRQTPEEGRRTYRLKRCGNKDEDNSPKIFNDKNQQVSSQKFRQLVRRSLLCQVHSSLKTCQKSSVYQIFAFSFEPFEHFKWCITEAEISNTFLTWKKTCSLAQWLECSPMIRETWVQFQVASYQRLLKWYLISPCLILSNTYQG